MPAKRLVVTIGDKLRAAREKLEKTQYEIAVASGLRPEVISRLENNKTAATLASLHKLAPVLGFSIDELVKSQGTPAVPTPPPTPDREAATKPKPSVKKTSAAQAATSSAKKPTKKG